MSKSKAVAGRDSTGKFLKGTSGNPNGRPKGAKGVIVQQKLALEQAVREGVSPEEIQGILKGLIAAAMEGDVTAARYVLDKFISNAKVEDESAHKDNGITIVVKNATFGAKEAEPIEGEAEIVTPEE